MKDREAMLARTVADVDATTEQSVIDQVATPFDLKRNRGGAPYFIPEEMDSIGAVSSGIEGALHTEIEP